MGVSENDGDERVCGQTWTAPANSEPSCERAWSRRGIRTCAIDKERDAYPERKVEGETQAGKVDDRKGQSFFGRQVFDVVYGTDEYREAGVVIVSVSQSVRGRGTGRTCPTMTSRLAMLR